MIKTDARNIKKHPQIINAAAVKFTEDEIHRSVLIRSFRAVRSEIAASIADIITILAGKS